MVIYRKRLENPHIGQLPIYHYADEYSKFTQKRELRYTYSPNPSLQGVTTSVSYYIDSNEVDEQTFNEVMVKIQDGYEIRTNKRCEFQIIEDGVGHTTWELNVGDDKMKPSIWDFLNEQAELSNRYSSLEVEKAVREKTLRKMLRRYDYNELFGGTDMNKNITITNYKYDEKTGRTTLWWSDNTQTTVTADPDTEFSQYVGFVSACAKKLFGNKSTYLNQFDKWTVKIPARQKAEAERKAAEEKELAERRAKRAAKKEEHKRQRLIDDIARSIVDDYNTADIIEAAEKRAVEKYGVPSDYIANRNNCECDCCKEQG